MSKEPKNAPDLGAPSTLEGGGGMNTGVAIVGFILCFIAGAGLMWGYDTHRLKKGDISADVASAGTWSDEDSPVPVSSKDPMWGKDPKMYAFSLQPSIGRNIGWAGASNAKAGLAFSKYIVVDTFAKAVQSGDAAGSITWGAEQLQAIYRG